MTSDREALRDDVLEIAESLRFAAQELNPAVITRLRARLAGVEERLASPDKSRAGARTRLLQYFLARGAGTPVLKSELAEVAGIQAWARRVRELREDGWPIKWAGGYYVLESDRRRTRPGDDGA